MTASLFVTGTPVARTVREPRGSEVSWSDVVHAVARPTIDGLESSVCGLLVTAAAGRDWTAGDDAPRCPECSRIADGTGRSPRAHERLSPVRPRV
jgi:hypothetical protein